MGHKDESQGPAPNFPKSATDDWELTEVLDQAISQLNSGDDIEPILAQYPAYTDVLRPLLRTAQAIQRVPAPVPDAEARQAGLDRLVAAAEVQRDERVASMLDTAISRLLAGEALDTILADYPAYADAMCPMLEAAAAISYLPQPSPDQQKKRQGRERLLRAVAARRPRLVTETDGTFEDALDEALVQLRDGADVATILDRYPAFASQMRPLLQVARDVQRVPQPIPVEEAYFAGRARVVELAARRRSQQRMAEKSPAMDQVIGLVDLLSRWLSVAPRLRQAAITVVLLVAMVFGGFSVTQVAADSLPTSPLYPVKRFAERIQLAFTPSTEAKAKLHLRLSQERLREAEALARQTGKVDTEVLREMLGENDQFLGKIENVSPKRRRDLLDEGAQLFDRQYQVLTELSDVSSPLSTSEREALRNFVDETSDDQAIAKGVQRDLAPLSPTPAPELPATAMPQPSPTPEPAEVEQQARPTPVPPTATPVPLTPTPQVPAEVEMPPLPQEQALPTATEPVQPSPEPATVAPAATPEPVATAQPVEATPVPTSEPTVVPAPTEPEPTSDLPPIEIGQPTLPPPQTPSP